MVFSSLPFLLGFMPVFFCTYYLVPGKSKNFILLLASLAFYAIGSVTAVGPAAAAGHFAVFLLSILVDYAAGRRIESRPERKKTILLLALIFHTLALGYFKYYPFLGAEIGKVIPCLRPAGGVLLPIGISFYTFQGISYIADVYRGREKAEKSLLRFCVYLSMFEQLIAGPIVTYGAVKEDLTERSITKEQALQGFGTFVFGLGLKVLLANPLGKLWKDVSTIGFESLSTPLAWMGIAGYSLQIYFDFFGYSVMAIGLGEMLGFRLPKNFDFPYLSCSMTEFWRRWHMTLGSWLREYVYIPLGGSRCDTAKTVRNLAAVWLLTGIWHGAGYHFILWGALLFLFMVSEKYLTGKYLTRWPVLGHLYMLFFIPLSWAVFEIGDLAQLWVFFTRLFPFFGQGPWSLFRYDYVKYAKLYWPFFLAGALLLSRKPFAWLKETKNRALVTLLLLAILGGSIYCMYRGFHDPFLYFRF